MMQKSFLDKSLLWKSLLWIVGGLFLVGVGAGFGLLLLTLSQTTVGAQAGSLITRLLAADTTQVTWYITRSAGLTAYLLLWLSTAWGLAVPSKILDGILHGSFTFEFHQFISLLAIGFTTLHVGVLLFDQYLPFNLAQIVFPFLSTYRPIWTGLGVLTFYSVLLVTITFYMRARIGMKAFRAIHLVSLLSFFGAAAHGLFAGTDSPLLFVRLMYIGTSLSIVFLTVYYLANRVMVARQKKLTAVR
jgi:methionine sulfoxide reductase heme-binding subunit